MHRTAVAVLVAAFLLMPLAQAQDPAPPDVGLALEGWTSPLAPASPDGVTLTIRYNCEKIPPQQGAKAWVNRSKPWWAFVTGPQVVNLTADPVGCTQNQGVGTRALDYNVTLSDSAPAVTPRTVTFNVTITYPDAHQANETSRDIAAEFVPQIQVAVEPRRSQALDGETARHNVTVTNLGNGPIEVTILTRDVPKKLQVGVPGPATVEAARNGSQPSWTGQITARGTLAPDVNFRNFTANLALTTQHAGNASLGGTGRDLQLTVFVRRPQEEIEERESLPGFGVPTAVTAAAAALWAVRQRKLL